jgi:alpha-N-arabinofuranosidase
MTDIFNTLLSRLLRRMIMVLSVAAICCGGLLHAATAARLNINTAARGQAENPHMWGLFIENICNDVDGGLFSQMIRNPDFKNDVPPSDCKVVGGKWLSPDGHIHQPPPGGPMLAWQPIAPVPHQVKLTVVSTQPLSPAHKLSLNVAVQSGNAGVGNVGYWGMPLHHGRKYLVTFYARSSGAAVALNVSLTNTLLSRHYARQAVTITSGHWRKYRCVLSSNGTTHQGMLGFTAHAPANFNLTLVQMFPMSRRTGKPKFFRSDIVRLLARLHPGFLRFPGGNFIEGISLADSYNWRKTVGPMIGRPGHMNFWGYRNTDGFGFMGWLRLTAKLHALPMYCTSAGLLWSAQTLKGTKLNIYIHRMLTAVAFANDPIGTRWGNLRAQYGHPAPFHIQYVEIGNENGGPSYDHNYPIMEAALHRAFPSVIPIADDWGGVPSGHLQIVDQHFYPAGRWFRRHANLYDARPADAPKVLVGEYAVGPTHSRYGDFRMTLAETAFMIGMERNCSKVIMASYGVTLDNAGASRAHINLVQFNDRTAFGRSMYWVQYLFNHEQPALVYPIHLDLLAHRRTLQHRFFADAGITADRRDLIIKVDNASNVAVPAHIHLRGPVKFAGSATVFTLHTPNPSLDNDFRHPDRIVPQRSIISAQGAWLHYRFKPYSITVLRLRIKP